MKINEFERQLAEQCSAMQAFPSQAPAIEQMYAGQNKRISIEAQIEVAKLLAAQDNKMARMNDTLNALLAWTAQQHAASQRRSEIEDQKSSENTRLSRIAAWSAVASLILAVLGIMAQIALK